MKKLFTLFAALLLAATVWAQSSNPKMSYQAVIRNSHNELVVNRNDLTVEITIKQADTVAYKETHSNVQTNQNGLVSLLIGTGTVNKGSLNAVDWTKAKISTSINLGDDETVSATTPVTAVPYALYADAVNPNSEFVNNIYDKINDTLKAYYDTTAINNKLDNYLTIDGLCDSIKNKCGEFATKTDVQNAADTLASKNSLNDYTKTTELCTYITSNCTDLATDAEVKAAADTLASKNSLADYATKTNVKAAADTLASKNSLNDYTKTTELCGYIKENCTDLATDAEVKAAADTLASKNSLADYATKTYVQNAVDTLVSNSDLANYYTKSETYSQSDIDTKFENYYTSSKIDDTLKNYALISQEKALTIKSLTNADSTKLLNDTTLTIPEDFTLDTDHLVKLYINGVYVGDNSDGVLVVTEKKVKYVPAQNGNYELTLGDRIKIIYWVKKN